MLCQFKDRMAGLERWKREVDDEIAAARALPDARGRAAALEQEVVELQATGGATRRRA